MHSFELQSLLSKSRLIDIQVKLVSFVVSLLWNKFSIWMIYVLFIHFHIIEYLFEPPRSVRAVRHPFTEKDFEI